MFIKLGRWRNKHIFEYFAKHHILIITFLYINTLFNAHKGYYAALLRTEVSLGEWWLQFGFGCPNKSDDMQSQSQTKTT